MAKPAVNTLTIGSEYNCMMAQEIAAKKEWILIEDFAGKSFKVHIPVMQINDTKNMVLNKCWMVNPFSQLSLKLFKIH